LSNKDIVIHQHCVHLFTEDSVLKNIFVKSEGNDADIISNDTAKVICNKHARNNMAKVINDTAMDDRKDIEIHFL
jgi:hypothetical protein